tara:strand:- start:1917 stop:2618 length:702 start_codon:yes stop_codon:yes gene_type:complete
MNNNKLSLFFTYFGGKWRIAKHYPAPTQETIIEPFAGSAGFSLHYPNKNILLFDLDPKICAVWDYLIRVSEKEILTLPEIFDDVCDLSISQESKWLIGFWLNKGTTQPCNIPSKWMRNKLRPNSYWGAAIKKRISTQLKFIRHWKIENKSYTEIDNQNAYWFIDPPYFRSGVSYKFNKIDYNNLSQWCQTRQGNVTACEQEGADWLPFVDFRTIKTLQKKNGSCKAKEMIWLK